MLDRRTKIVCTLGPAVASGDGILRLVEDGMNVARLNMSHGEHADHEANYKWVREATEKTGRNVGILADLQGPKIRLGRFKNGEEQWDNGEIVRITVDDVEGTHDRVSTTYKGLAQDAKPGDRLLIDDGKVAVVTGTGEQKGDVTLAVRSKGKKAWVVVGGWWPSLGAKGKPDLGGRQHVLLIGSDARPGQKMSRARADALQLVGVDGTGGAGVMGFARDLWVPIPGHGHGKLNAAMVYRGPAAKFQLQARHRSPSTGPSMRSAKAAPFRSWVRTGRCSARSSSATP